MSRAEHDSKRMFLSVNAKLDNYYRYAKPSAGYSTIHGSETPRLPRLPGLPRLIKI